jgi:hypothetical protein
MFTDTKSRFHAIRLRLENHVSTSPAQARLWELALFVFKQGWACLFGAILLVLELLTKWRWPAHAPLARYDFLFMAALAVQALLLILRMETVREAKVILVFHVVGTVMDISGTQFFSHWARAAVLRIYVRIRGQLPGAEYAHPGGAIHGISAEVGDGGAGDFDLREFFRAPLSA